MILDKVRQRAIELLNNFSGLFLVLYAMSILAYKIYSFIHPSESNISETSQILGLLGLICFSIGIEKVITLSKIQNSIDTSNTSLIKIEEIAKNSSDDICNFLAVFDRKFNAEYHDSILEILSQVKLLASRAESSIYVLSFDLLLDSRNITPTQEEIEAYRDWSNTIRKTIKNSSNFDYKMIYVVNDSLTKKDVKNFQKERYKFDKDNLLSRCKFKFKQMALVVSILIIDDKYLLIAFPTSSSDPRPSNAILLKDNPLMVKRFTQWFLDYLWQESIEFPLKNS